MIGAHFTSGKKPDHRYTEEGATWKEWLQERLLLVMKARVAKAAQGSGN